MNTLVPILTSTVWVLSFLFTCYIFYYFVMSLFTFKRLKKREQHEPATRFALLIAARNEEQVVGRLVESLLAQDYPRELFDVIVAPNNCTDHTADAARAAGARIIECTGPVRSKGEVLEQAFDRLMEEARYDAVCIYDADNLVHPGFLRAMNDAYCSGARIAQGYRDSKNPYDTAISSCYSIYYWMINRLYNHTRQASGLSAMVNGSGFMVGLGLVRELGGWHTVTMTEDIEFTTQCILHGEKVEWVPEAVVYDEQPLTFAQSWKQRKRWSTGILQGFSTYFGKLGKALVRERRPALADQMVFFLAPFMQMAYVASLLLGVVLNLLYIQHQFFPQTELYLKLFVSINYSYFLSAAMALITIILERKGNMRLFKGVATYWLFILSWVPINIACLCKKCTTWDEIRHTRSISLAELNCNR